MGKNNPLFVNFRLPQTTARLADIATQKTYNFRARPPAIGKSVTGFRAQTVVPVNANFGATVLTGPNKDIGTYPTGDSGNKH